MTVCRSCEHKKRTGNTLIQEMLSWAGHGAASGSWAHGGAAWAGTRSRGAAAKPDPGASRSGYATSGHPAAAAGVPFIWPACQHIMIMRPIRDVHLLAHGMHVQNMRPPFGRPLVPLWLATTSVSSTVTAQLQCCSNACTGAGSWL